MKPHSVLIAASVSLFAGVAHANPLGLLFGGEPKANAATAAPVSAKRLGDAEMSCAQLYAEVQQIEALIAKSQSDAQTQSSGQAGKQVLSGIAQSLLGAAPMLGGSDRGGMVAGMVAQQAAQQVATNQAMQGMQQSQQAQIDAAVAAQRREHLVNLFEEKRCNVSELKK